MMELEHSISFEDSDLRSDHDSLLKIQKGKKEKRRETNQQLKSALLQENAILSKLGFAA